MNRKIEEILDNDETLQRIIMTPEWAHYARATLIGRALHACFALGANELEAREYLEIDSSVTSMA
jgi:hypothetical protein